MFDIAVIFAPANIFFTFLGTLIGVTVGAIPGITTTMTIALFLPFTFGMAPISSFGLLLGIYAGGQFGGSIAAILINTPGTPSSTATVLDGYPMAQQGKGLEALSTAVISSFVGGIFSCFILIVFASRLAQITLQFGPAEYFAVGVFALSIVANLSADNLIKGFISANIGLLLATIGMDPITGAIRLTFGYRAMIGGIHFIAALTGLFAICEVISKLEKKDKAIDNVAEISGKMVSLSTLKANTFNFIRSCIIGVIVGVTPGTGGSTAAWLSYNEAKRGSKNKESFGKGNVEGVVAPETANSALTGGCLVPVLTLGIPGDAATAVILGAFMIHGLTPGLGLFTNHPEVVTGIYTMLILSNIFVLVLGLGGARLFAKVLQIPTNILMPLVFIICLTGAYASNLSIFNMQVAFVLGVFAYILKKADFPIPPILLGIILQPIIEANFRRALTMSHGSFAIFLRPISLLFLSISVAAFLFPIISAQYYRYKNNSTA